MFCGREYILDPMDLGLNRQFDAIGHRKRTCPECIRLVAPKYRASHEIPQVRRAKQCEAAPK